MKKTIKQYVYFSEGITKQQLSDIKKIAINYTNAKNYFYSRFSGVNSYANLFNYRSEIRDIIVSEISKNKKYNFNLPARYWKNALDESISNIKSNWANTISKTKSNLRSKGILTKNELHYCNYVLNSPKLLQEIFNFSEFLIPEKINYSDINFKKLNKLIRRTIRYNRFTISKTTKKNNFTIDNNMYTYEDDCICIQSLEKGKRIKLKVNTNDRFNKTIKVILGNDRITFNSSIVIKVKENAFTNNIIGIDKNYENVIATSSGNVYGDGINKLFNEYADLTVKQEKERNKIRNLIKLLKRKEGNELKIERIIKNNLGTKKITRAKNKKKEEFKSLINKSLNDFINQENPTEIVTELLNFQGGNKKLNKKTKHKLNTWSKGYIRERIEYKGYVNNIKITEINATDTSQTCSCCGYYSGSRSDGNMFYCLNCGEGVLAHLNSAVVIRQRRDDKEIKLHTPHKEVHKILTSRNKRLVELKLDQPRLKTLRLVSGQSESELSETYNFYKFFEPVITPI